MTVMESIEKLQSAREILRTSLEKSEDIASVIDKTGPRLEQISQSLPSLEASIRTIARKASLFSIRDHINPVLGPASALIKLFDATRSLEDSLLSEQCSNLTRYLSVLRQLEEALKFLSDNSGLVIRWLDDVLPLLDDYSLDDEDDFYLSKIKKSLRILEELRAIEERSRLSGGVLCSSLNKLEFEFRHILGENSFPLPFTSSFDPLPLPDPVIYNLQAIIERLSLNNRLENCMSIFIEVRSSNARKALQTLDLEYLDITLSEFVSVQSIESCIDQWEKHLEFSVTRLLELEFRLCHGVFEKLGSDVYMGCFAKIAIQSGIHGLIEFGNTITKGKKDAIKLLKLLDIFANLNRLRLDFNRLFGGKACVEIQTQMRDLIKKIVDGASQIFSELSSQVELQRQSDPPQDGSVPRLVSFVTDYCNQILDDHYKPILIQVLEIHLIWENGKFEEGVVENEVRSIINAIELNLQRWAKTYEDSTLSYIFLMNNHWYFYRNLKGTKLGDLMGDSWLKGHEHYMEYYVSIFMRESWGNIIGVLSEDGLVKKRLKEFNEGFDDMCKKQSKWVIVDKGLRVKICQLVVKIVVPVYSSFVENYLGLVEESSSPRKCVKYSAESLEIMLSSLFQPKLGKFGSTKCTHLIGKIKNVVTNHFSSTPAVA